MVSMSVKDKATLVPLITAVNGTLVIIIILRIITIRIIRQPFNPAVPCAAVV